jgi:nucleotide-binding universal stress UspA family protein
MKQRILVPADETALAEIALRTAVRLSKADDLIHLLHVVPEFRQPVGLPATSAMEIKDRAAEQLVRLRNRSGELLGRELVREGDAGRIIPEVAQEVRAHLIVMGTHARSAAARWMLGSVAAAVVKAGAAPVVLVRPGVRPPRELRRILVALDGTAKSARVIDDVGPLALRSKAEVVLLRVEAVVNDPMPQFAGDVAKMVTHDAGRGLQELADGLDERGVTGFQVVGRGDPAKEIVRQAARLGADLVAMASRTPVVGSVAEAVLRGAAVPVLLRKIA